MTESITERIMRTNKGYLIIQAYLMSGHVSNTVELFFDDKSIGVYGTVYEAMEAIKKDEEKRRHP